ncbi:polysaccharide deacetylase family protein [Sphingomonas sp.]|uniref:polysaccharide deacetylase family protein n=1 Tax=Sphingomonas sp. TaxID=28214 RepID=UPI0025D2677D|nr:polysaccharide deacetylase family protein [Sphingomonas sp.]
MTRRLLASIHDVGPKFEAQIDALSDRLTGLLDGTRFAMLVVPDHWDRAPLSASPAFAARLRRWAEDGVEMFLHGWRHRDDAPASGFARQHMTAGEGEFSALTQAQAATLIADGRKLVEDAIGRPVAGFIAPAWLYSPGALAAVREAGFVLAEDHLKVWNPVAARTLARGPVITWASRSPGRIRSSLMFAGLARATLVVLPTVRIAVHPGDTTVPALLDSIDATFARFTATHTPSRYADLLR